MNASEVGAGPFWVKSGPRDPEMRLPLYPVSGHRLPQRPCPLRAINGHANPSSPFNAELAQKSKSLACINKTSAVDSWPGPT
jgi:hypothetical protein